jgi:hypothetical protein
MSGKDTVQFDDSNYLAAGVLPITTNHRGEKVALCVWEVRKDVDRQVMLNDIGGKKDPGESTWTTALREFKEETGDLGVMPKRSIKMVSVPNSISYVVHLCDIEYVDEDRLQRIIYPPDSMTVRLQWCKLDDLLAGAYSNMHIRLQYIIAAIKTIVEHM